MAEIGETGGPGDPGRGRMDEEPAPPVSGADPLIQSEPGRRELATPASKLRKGATALGCAVLAIMVLLIALIVGVFDVVF